MGVFSKDSSLDERLWTNEEIIWRQKPNCKRLLTRQDLFMIPFSILWGGFALGIAFLLLSRGALGEMPPVFFIFPVVGLYLIFGRFVHRYFVLKNSEYIVTNKRLLIKKNRAVIVIEAAALPPFNVRARADGSGTIIFHPPVQGLRPGLGSTPFGDYEYALENVNSIKSACAALAQLKESR